MALIEEYLEKLALPDLNNLAASRDPLPLLVTSWQQAIP